jgi:flagellar protein FliS
MNNAYNAYRNNSINFASKEQLLLMLLDGAVKFSKMARQALVDKNIERANENIKKVQNIFYELIATFDLTKAGEWGEKLVGVYKYIINELVKANFKKDVSIMDGVILLIEQVREMWKEAYDVSIKTK